MIKILILATFAFKCITSDELSSDFEVVSDVSITGNCKDACVKCELPGKKVGMTADTHACAAKTLAVDPFLLGGRCRESSCDMCGTQEDCVDNCQQFKRDNNLGGWPQCANVCNGVKGDYKCFLAEMPPDGTTKKPMCYPRYDCEEEFCSIGTNPKCAAYNNIVDPWKCLKGDRCKKVKCDKCGNQNDCVTMCEKWNTIRARQGDDATACIQKCKEVKGYKCFQGCTSGGVTDEMEFEMEDVMEEDILAVNMNVNGSEGGYIQSHIWYILSFVLFFIVAVGYGMYKSRGEKQVNATETDSLLEKNYGSVGFP